MAEIAYINPDVLKWARESAHISIDTAAAKIKVPIEKLEYWEKGEVFPTIVQAEKLAKIYKRPFAAFFLPEIPEDFSTLKDFRMGNAPQLSTASVFMIREVQQKQEWIKELFREADNKPLKFVGKFSLNNNPADVAADILQVLNIKSYNFENKPPSFKEWIEKTEKAGIFVSRASNINSHYVIDCAEMRGFSIADVYAPFVFINAADWKNSQLFTLMHELAHIWIAESGISNEIIYGIENKEKFDRVEIFCNKVAANVLMPAEYMENLRALNLTNYQDFYKQAGKLKVSSLAFVNRCYELKFVNYNSYLALKEEAEIEYKNYLKKEEEKKVNKTDKGKPDYFRLLLNKNGNLFTQIVIDTYRSGEIQATVAGGLLNTKIYNFNKFEGFYLND